MHKIIKNYFVPTIIILDAGCKWIYCKRMNTDPNKKQLPVIQAQVDIFIPFSNSDLT